MGDVVGGVMASAKQVSYCRTLLRKSKIYYKTLSDARLAMAVRERTGYDLDNLTAEQARAVILHCKAEIRVFRPDFR